jgi:pimeloyl-ACP methyl ester carboxylesterase
MRLIFIHGFGELPTVFDNIAPYLSGEKIFINVWKELKPVSVSDPINVQTFAQQLIEKYQITANDAVIGHSMGGWIAAHIKQKVGSKAILIASLTDQKKIIVPTHSLSVMRFLHYNSLYINGFSKKLFSLLVYRKRPSRAFFEETLDRLVSAPKDEVYKQIRILFEPVPALSIVPDIRIHAKADVVLSLPDEPYHLVPGDHFTLVTDPETVWKPIVETLAKPTL